MTEKILCVDDDANILSAYERNLRRRFSIQTALGGEEALKIVRNDGPFAIVAADMRMPGLNGIELLTKIREIAPDTVRIMLTGNAEQQTAVEAINKGHIFRFLNKPCSPEFLGAALESGLQQYRLITAEGGGARTDEQTSWRLRSKGYRGRNGDADSRSSSAKIRPGDRR
ncbi:MAG: response regulator [Verrucomicrobia bacterium]|nr:response regulator [Verrucomicrobiota bacterium]